MKALVLEKDRRLAYGDVPDPDVQSAEVLKYVSACGICGSDVHGMDGSIGKRMPPLIMGRIPAKRGFRRVHRPPIRDRIPIARGRLLRTCLDDRASGCRGSRRAQSSPVARGTASVVGAGIIGLFLVQVLNRAGLTDVEGEVISRTQGKGADVVFEAAGTARSFRTARFGFNVCMTKSRDCSR